MKKFALYSAAAFLAFSLVACDGYEEPNPTPQTNPQEAIINAADVAVAPAVSSEIYDLGALNEANQNIVISTITAPVPAGYDLSVVASVSNNGFERVNPIPASVVANEDGNYSVVVAPADLNTLYTSKYSMNPADATLELRYLLQIAKGSEVAYIGGPSNFYGPYTINFKPVDSGLILENSYYLVGNMCDWNISEAIAFTATGDDPWNNPVFYVVVDITEDMVTNGCYWKVIPGSVQATGGWGSGVCSQWGVEVNGDTAFEGTLLPATADSEPNAGMIEVAGRYKWTINVLEGTYVIEPIVPTSNLWTPGNSNGWSFDGAQMLAGTDGSTFTGYAHLDGEFKFTNEAGWGGINYGSTGEEGKLSTDGGAGNLNAPENGLYWCNVDVENLTYSLTHIYTIGMIGSFNGWGSSQAMTPSDDFLTWTGEVTLTSGDEFKFRANDGWDINLGGSISDLTQGGDNLTGFDGDYTVTLNLGTLPYTCTMVKK